MRPLKHPMFIMIIALMFGIMGVFATDIYTPALPAIQKALHISVSMTQLTVTVYFLGLFITPLMIGPLSDAIGRRKILIVAAWIAVAGSLICATAHTITGVITGRIAQGVGLGIGISLSRTICRDLFEGKKLAEVISIFSLLMGLAPILAPLLGSYLQHWYGWRGSFYFLFGYLFIISTAILGLFPETLSRSTPFHPRIIVQNYLELLKGPAFISNTIASAVATGSLIVFFITAPFLLQKELHVSVLVYGWIITTITMISFGSRTVNVFLIRKLSSHQIVKLGLLLIFMGGLILLLTAIGTLSIATIMVSAILLVSGTGLIYSNAVVGALMPYRHMSGTAGALLGSIQMFGGFLASAVASHFAKASAINIALELLILSSIALSLMIFVNDRAKVEVVQH